MWPSYAGNVTEARSIVTPSARDSFIFAFQPPNTARFSRSQRAEKCTGLLKETQKPQEGEERVRGGFRLALLCSSCKDPLIFFPHFNRLHKDHPETYPQNFPPRFKGKHELKPKSLPLGIFLQHITDNMKLNQTAVQKKRKNQLAGVRDNLAADSPSCCSLQAADEEVIPDG